MAKMYRINYVTVILTDEFLEFVQKEYKNILKTDPQNRLLTIRTYFDSRKKRNPEGLSYEQFVDEMVFSYHAKDFLSQLDMYNLLQGLAQYKPIVFFVTKEAMEEYFGNFRVDFDCIVDKENPPLSLINPNMYFDSVDKTGLMKYIEETGELQ